MDRDETPDNSVPASPPDPASSPDPASPRTPLRTTSLAFLGPLVATAVLGIPAGYIWALVAPRALAQIVSHGAANVVNAETTAFIVADAWFVLIAAAGGLLTGIAGYVYVVRRRGAPAALGLILGGLAAAAIMWWIGDHYGHASFQHALLTRPIGSYLHASLTLGSKAAVVFWPLFAALAIGIPEVVAYARGDRSNAVRNVDEAAAHGARSID